MRFEYKRYGPDFLRPVIPVELLTEREHVSLEVLVDSGADCNLVPGEIGELLGLDVTSGRKSVVGGITGDGLPFYVHDVRLRLGGTTVTVPMGFMPAMPAFGYGVVGQRGFFDHFQVSFDYPAAIIDVTPHGARP